MLCLINNEAAVSEAAANDLSVPPDPLHAAVSQQNALFTSSFLNVQLNRHIRLWSCTAGLMCLSRPAFGFSLILSKSNCPSVSTVSSMFPSCSFSPTYSPAVSTATSQDGLSCFFWGAVVAFLSFAFCFPSVPVFCGDHSSSASLLTACLSFSAPAPFCHSLLLRHNFHLVLCHSVAI